MLLLGGGVSAPAQTTSGSIYGTVTDAQGGVVPGIRVVAVNLETKQSNAVQTNASGDYIFQVLQPGSYTVKAQGNGFQTSIQTGLALSANQNIHANFTLALGSVDQVVTVTGSTVLVDTRESQLGTTIDRQRIQELPLASRNAYDLVQLVPGVTNYAVGSQIGDNSGTRFSVNGNRVNFNAYYLDGAYDTSMFHGGGNVIPNPDALEEFRLLTSNFDAEFGRYPGGVVNIITRSGANAIHGVVYDYLRNNILNAKPYFQTSVPRLV
ncbi:MAG: TonB-dependent receptor, partial [Acidobacteriota bacterium]